MPGSKREDPNARLAQLLSAPPGVTPNADAVGATKPPPLFPHAAYALSLCSTSPGVVLPHPLPFSLF